MEWGLITDVIVATAIIVVGLFACLALYQWFTRKSLAKIDPELRWATVPLLLMAATYFIFDHLLIWNTRPNGSGEPSFPSTHTMITATVFFIVIILLPRYIQSRGTRLILDAIMIILIILVATGRVLANMHWVSDVEGGILFALIFAVIYYFILQKPKLRPDSPTRSQPNKLNKSNKPKEHHHA